MFGVSTGRAAIGGGRSPGVLLLAAALLTAPQVRAQSLDEWIQRFGEAAARQNAADRTGPTGSGGSGSGSGGSGAPATAAAATAGPGGTRACGAALGSGELVLRGGANNDCGIRQLSNAVRDAAQAMNERRGGRERSRDMARECDSEEACRRDVRTERLKEVSSLKHEEDQMARTHNAPRNVTIPPARKAGGNWNWQTYQLGR